MNTSHASSSQMREAPALLVRPVSDQQKKLAAALAFQLSGRGQMPRYQKRVEVQLLAALQAFGGQIVGFDTRPTTYPATDYTQDPEELSAQ